MDNSDIIKRIEVKLKELSLTKKEFYESTGISSASFSQWKSNTYAPTDKKLKAAANFLGVSFEYLAGKPEKEETAPAAISEDDLKAAFFGGIDPSMSKKDQDEMWEEARDYMMYKISQRQKEKNG